MRRARLPVGAMKPWAALNGLQLSGVEIVDLDNGQGCGIVASRDEYDEGTVFLEVPQELVLSKDLVWNYARSDPDLRQVLDAMGEYAKTPQGAIVLFLLVQVTASCPEVTDRIGLPNPFTDYVKFLPDERGLPSRWSEAELECLWGTSLKNHMAVKQHSLLSIFDELREKTQAIAWCEKWWWDAATGILEFDDFKEVDAMFRSRAMDFGEQGQSLVPVMDMANHDHADHNVALYEIDKTSGGAMMVLQWGRHVQRGYEITINYGSDRSASDMLHAYGFIEEMPHAGSIFVSFPNDFGPFEADPLAEPKFLGLKLVPGVKFYIADHDRVKFHSPFVYAMSVNEEDGLGLDVARTVDDDFELQFRFHDTPVDTADELVEQMQEDVLWDLFQWRAHAYLSMLLDGLIMETEKLDRRPLAKKLPEGITEDSHAWRVSRQLRTLELTLLRMIQLDFGHRLDHLQNSQTVLLWREGKLGPSASSKTPSAQSSFSYKHRRDSDCGVDDGAEYEPTQEQAQLAVDEWNAAPKTSEPAKQHEASATQASPSPPSNQDREGSSPGTPHLSTEHSDAKAEAPNLLSTGPATTVTTPSSPHSPTSSVVHPSLAGLAINDEASSDVSTASNGPSDAMVDEISPNTTPDASPHGGKLRYLGRMRFSSTDRREFEARQLAKETHSAMDMEETRAAAAVESEGMEGGQEGAAEREEEEDDFS